MTFPSDPKDEFPVCPDCGSRHSPLPENIVLSTHALLHIQTTLTGILAFSQQHQIPLTVISGMVQTFHAEIMDELMTRKKQIVAQLAAEEAQPFIVKLQEFLKGGPDYGGLQKETGRTESKEQSPAGGAKDPGAGTENNPGGSKKGSGGTILH